MHVRFSKDAIIENNMRTLKKRDGGETRPSEPLMFKSQWKLCQAFADARATDCLSCNRFRKLHPRGGATACSGGLAIYLTLMITAWLGSASTGPSDHKGKVHVGRCM